MGSQWDAATRGCVPPGAAAGGSGAGPEVWSRGGVGVEVGAPGRGFRAGHPRQPPALPGQAGRPRGGACRGGAAGTGEAGGAGNGQGTRWPHGGGSERRGRRRPLAPGRVPPPSARSPDGPAGGGPGPRCPGAGGRARGSTVRASAPRDPERPRTGGGARAGGACAGPGAGPRALAVAGAEEPRAQGPPPAPPPSWHGGLPGAPAFAAVAGGCVEVEAGTSETLVLWLFRGREGPPGGTWGAPSPQRGRVGASPTGSVSRDSRGSPRLGIPRPQQTDPQGRAPGGCGPAGEAHWRVS